MKLLLVMAGMLLKISLVAQNAGIGTTTPTLGRLQVNGDVGRTVAIFGGDGAGVAIMKNEPAIGFNRYYNVNVFPITPGSGFIQRLDMISGSMVFEQQGGGTVTRRLTIEQNGNVAVNATASSASLFVVSSLSNAVTARFRGTTYYSAFNEGAATTQHTTINGGKAGSKVFINDQSLGNVSIGGGTSKVGINTANPTAMLTINQVGGTGLIIVAPALSYHNWEFVTVKNSTEPGSDLYTFYDESFYKGNFFHIDGKYYKVSDRRFKTDIQPMSAVLEKVMMLNPAEYEMIYDNPGNFKSIGFVAQEVKRQFPELTGISPGNSAGYKNIENVHTINYEGFGVLAIKAIQEQQKLIAALEKKIADIKQRVIAAKNSAASQL